jgi:peptidylprolyl isomerase
MSTDKDYYAILGVSPDADHATIEEAYERLAREVQPNADLEPTNPERMRELDEAFDVLDDADRRADYDRARTGTPAAEPAPPAWTAPDAAATAATEGAESAPEVPADASPRAAPVTVTKGGADRGLIAGVALLVGGVAALVAGIAVLVVALTDDDGGAGGPGYVTEGGVQVTETQIGYGPAAESGDVVTVHYTGRLESGEEFDSSVGGTPFSLILDTGQVIPGWDEGLAGIQTGGKRTLVIPPDLAYGEEGGGPIPPNATLIFEIEALGVSDTAAESPPDVEGQREEQDSGLVIIDVEEGQGAEAKSGDQVFIHYTGWLEADGTQIDTSLVTPEVIPFAIGQEDGIEGWSQGIPGMKEGGTRRLIVPPALAFGEEGAGDGQIPPGATLIFDIQLIEVVE